MMERLKQKRLFLFDIDGTLSLGNTLFDGSRELIEYIASIGGKAVYITNNSTKSVDAYIEKFARWGLTTDASNFITASFITVDWLQKHFPKEKIFAVGTRSFVKELRKAGLTVTETPDEDVKCVLVGFDSELTYEKLTNACKLLQTKPELTFAATNPDLVCPIDYGFIPDCGSICQMIVNAVKREPIYLGKPNPAMVEYSLHTTGFSPEQTLVVGDRLYTDIACGIAAKVDTCLVYTGEAKEADLADTEFMPTFVFENVRKLLEAVKE